MGIPATSSPRPSWPHGGTSSILFRGDGADNVTWLWTVNQDGPKTEPIAQWWPGKAYVTWVGIDGYYTSQNDTFYSVFGRTIHQVRRITKDPFCCPRLPWVLTTDRLAKITDLFDGLATYRMLGLVWFDLPRTRGPQRELADRRQPARRKRLQAARHLATGRTQPASRPIGDRRGSASRIGTCALDQHVRSAAEAHPLGPVHLGELLDLS